MEKYIEIGDAEKYLRRLADEKLERSGAQFAIGVCYAANCIGDAPTAEVRPVVHGRWKTSLTVAGEFWANYCSVCGAYLPYSMEWKPNFCPQCGAEMRKKNTPKMA